MEVLVESIRIPANSTLGYGLGRTRDGSRVIFAGDQRPMRLLGEAVAASSEPIPVDVPDEAIIAIALYLGPLDEQSNGA